ncbi:zinc ribbon domain-containing protein [Methanobrevibacter sp.]|uniref:zinc ribbon domain-containing protein n=1 Tax=Methanobrevibacter sp. TaxID=66852 RepID=UPI0026DF7D70|nr:zinc ribbon domain-containing protein [Methanobrevibacter sp.]
MSKYCPKCGNKLKDKSRFCVKCGYDFINDDDKSRFSFNTKDMIIIILVILIVVSGAYLTFLLF